MWPEDLGGTLVRNLSSPAYDGDPDPICTSLGIWASPSYGQKTIK